MQYLFLIVAFFALTVVPPRLAYGFAQRRIKAGTAPQSFRRIGVPIAVVAGLGIVAAMVINVTGRIPIPVWLFYTLEAVCYCGLQAASGVIKAAGSR